MINIRLVLSYIQQLNFLDFGALSGIVAENHFGLSLEYKQGIHVTTGTWSEKKQITLPISLSHYSLASVIIDGEHHVETAVISNKESAGFKIHGGFNQGYPLSAPADIIIIGVN